MLNLKVERISFTNLKMVIFLLLLIQTSIVFAQLPKLEFSTLNDLEDISNSNGIVITQDSVGYLWIGTERGLFRYDGQTVFNYRNNENGNNSLPSGRINKLFVDSKKNLWLCTNEGLYKYNPEFDNFSPIVVDSDLRGVPGYNISAIAEDRTGQLFIAYEKSIYKYDRSQNLFSKVTELKEGVINALIFDDQNNIWIAASSNGGLHYYDQKKQQGTSFLNDPADKQSISNNEVFDVALVKGKLWIATNGGGIDSYNLTDKTFKHYIFPEYFDNYALSIFIDKKKNIWICTLGSIKLFDPSTDHFYDYYYQPNNPRPLDKGLRSFFEDNQGNYWTVPSVGGIRVVKSKNKFNHIDTHPENFWRTSKKNITSVSVDGSGHLWIGNFYNGIDVFNWEEQKTERYVHKENDPGSLGNGTIFSIFLDSKKQMWIGSNMGGLQQFNPETKSFKTYTNKLADTLSIAGNDVRSISEDDNGDLWIAVQKKGVDRFDIKNKTFHHFNSKNNHLSNDYAFQVLNDSKGNLWVGTAWGLNLLRKGETIFKNFMFIKGDSTTINNNEIHSIHEDRQQNIWVGTPEGLNKFNYATQTFARYSAGLKNKQVAGILSDQKNNIWVSTPVGISKFDPHTQRFINFDRSDGLLSKEFFDRACCRDEHNELFFGGYEGIDLFNPDSLNIETKRPTVVLTDFKLFNKSISYKKDSTIIQKHISYAKKIVLDYKSNSFTFLYQGINLTNSDKISYAFRLDGFDRNWIDAGEKREANYTNLSPGEYTFRVKAKYENGNWNEKETTIELDIVPAWWMTTWFKILMGLVLLTTPFAFAYWRTKRLRDQREKLEMIVAERTIEIQSKNDQLRNLNSTKDKLFSIISHDLRSPFSAILGFQDLLADEYYNLTDTERLDMINQVQSSSKQIYSLVENLLNWARIQTNMIQYNPVSFQLKEVILEKISLYRNIAEVKGISLVDQIPDDLVAFADKNLLETTLRNLINNAIKFTASGGTILVKASKKDTVIEISVIDSGTGMTKEQTDTLFNIETMHTKQGTKGEKGSGLGLVLCKEFVEKNKGLITVESQPGKGSIFSFTVPASPTR